MNDTHPMKAYSFPRHLAKPREILNLVRAQLLTAGGLPQAGKRTRRPQSLELITVRCHLLRVNTWNSVKLTQRRLFTIYV